MLEHKLRRLGTTLLGAAIALLLASHFINPQRRVHGATQQNTTVPNDWPVYNGGATGNHYSPLTQINRDNVKQLQPVWRVDVGTEGGLQTNPLIADEPSSSTAPRKKSSPSTLQPAGRYGSSIQESKLRSPSRGFSYWTDGIQSMLFAGVMDHLYALDPATGKPIPTFGEGGSVDLRKDLGNEDFTSNFDVLTSPGAIYKDMIIVGFRAPETHPAPHGDIRAYDVHTGKLRWSFHTIPHPSEPGYETWPEGAWKTAGAANNWPGMVVDQQRGIIFAPTGSAVDDFYGADRVGNDLYANCLLALDANTGKLIWHFQGVHHDIWDRDFPSPPVLVTVQRGGKSIDAVAQTSKQGFVYLFERTTGKQLFPLEEKSYPSSTVPGEVASPVQSLPLVPAPFSRQLLTADMLTNRTPEAHAWAVEQFSKFRSEGQFIPLSVGKETIVFPGYDGGAEWGGPAVDPHKAIIYINANDVAWTGSLAQNQTGGPGFTLYQSQCALCHGANRKGSPPQFPALLGVSDRLSDSAIESLIHTGKGRMSAFPAIQGDSLHALIKYLHTGPGADASSEHTDKVEAQSPSGNSGVALQYHFTGYNKFLDPDGYPAVAPPWGTLNAIDLNTGKYLWKIPFGQYPELAAKGMTQTGSESYGGPILTASGLLIIGAPTSTVRFAPTTAIPERYFGRAICHSPENATPATYIVDGKQYIVIATSGARDKKAPARSRICRLCPALTGKRRALHEHNSSPGKFSFDLHDRSIEIDRPASVANDLRFEPQPSRIQRRIPNAIVVSQSDQKNASQPSLAQISAEPSRRGPVIFKEGRVRIDVRSKTLAQNQLSLRKMKRRMKLRTPCPLNAVIGPERLRSVGKVDRLEMPLTLMHTGKRMVSRRMPVLSQQHVFEGRRNTVNDIDDLIAISNGKRHRPGKNRSEHRSRSAQSEEVVFIKPLHFYIAPTRRSSSICLGFTSSSVRTASVCSPSNGGGSRYTGGVSDILTGLATLLTIPSSGCSISTIKARSTV